jgi:hypothetical protein
MKQLNDSAETYLQSHPEFGDSWRSDVLSIEKLK